ncbi:RNI-like protein, partial [Basidiobolus meristosporus CBS 931.73]
LVQTRRSLRLDRLEFFICHRLQLDSICTLIKQNPNLTQVRFPGCVQVDDEVLLLLARHCPSLEYLDLRACSNVTDRGIQAVARNCPSLSFLNVGRTSDGEHITDRSVMEIAANTNITTLGVSGCNVSDEGLLALIQHRKGQLERLSLNHCSSITDRSMAQLVSCTNLSVLEVKGCVLIRNMRIFQLLHHKRVFLELCPVLQARFQPNQPPPA